MKKGKKFLTLVLVMLMCLSTVFITDSYIESSALYTNYDSFDYWNELNLSDEQVVLKFNLNGGNFNGGVSVFDLDEKLFTYYADYDRNYYYDVPRSNDQFQGQKVNLPVLKNTSTSIFGGWLCLYNNIKIKPGASFEIPRTGTKRVMLELIAIYTPLENQEHISNLYNLGEETYSFTNFGDNDSAGGHCFGMAVTSSGYHMGLLNKSNIDLSNNKTLYSLGYNEKLTAPICHYQRIQGIARDNSIVAGGTYYKYWPITSVKSDWKEIVNYVKEHEHDNKGDLVIVYSKLSEGGHAVNFLRYKVVKGQERIYAYDNNFPTKETYFFQDEYGNVGQANYTTFSGAIDCIALVDAETFFSAAGNFVVAKTFYAPANSIDIEGAYMSPMCVGDTTDEIMMYEILEDETEVIITPLMDNATFTYMDEEYSFGKIDSDTYAEFTLSTSEEEIPKLEIINAPADEQKTTDELFLKIIDLIKALISLIVSFINR